MISPTAPLPHTPGTGRIIPPPARCSVFAGADVYAVTGLRVRHGACRPRFEDDTWDLTGLADAPKSMPDHQKIWDFTKIRNPLWRTVAKEHLLALLLPRHEAVAALPHAPRKPMSPRSGYKRLYLLTSWLNWLTDHHIAHLEQVTQDECEQYLAEKSRANRSEGAGRIEPGSQAHIVTALQGLAAHNDMYSTDRYPEGFIPWNGASAAKVVGYEPDGENKTPPLPDAHLRPLLAAALYLVNEIGPHAADLADHVDSVFKTRRTHPREATVTGHAEALRAVLRRHQSTGTPLSPAADATVTRRLQAGWDPSDPLLRIDLAALAALLNRRTLSEELIEHLRPELQDVAERVGCEQPWGRQAARIPRADDQTLVPWTPPLSTVELTRTTSLVYWAAYLVTAALTGMRSSELQEIVVGSRREPVDIPGGGRRFRLASKVIKNKQFGGQPDEWVVIAQVNDAVALAERLRRAPRGTRMFSKWIPADYHRFRDWVNGPDGQRLGLEPIPPGPCNPRMLRRTLAQQIARRPAGLLAAKAALKHVSVATTEGYTARPGGSQAAFLSETTQEEQHHKLQLTAQLYRDYRDRRSIPAGPGARRLLETFAHVDAELKNLQPTEPNVMTNDRRIENLLRRTADTLHLGIANYCWFRDPAQALCLRLAGRPTATKPLAGMCDSTRCPQATHHSCHKPVWEEHQRTQAAFLGNPRIPDGEKKRMQTELERTRQVIAHIDSTTNAPQEGAE
ncbi:hypothetical protein ACGFJT_42000 [Actinomadura geliboluensis]|uniref:hypothetical protein n=1 Tax=Actinomadura geliboluensis TaxID=882440 RepID=UPI003716C0DC